MTELADLLSELEALDSTEIQSEFRLYYDDNGKVITYTCDDLPGNYLVITKEQYHECRHDVIVKKGKIIPVHLYNSSYKLVKSNTGVYCSKYDINIIVSEQEDGVFWNVKHYDTE